MLRASLIAALSAIALAQDPYTSLTSASTSTHPSITTTSPASQTNPAAQATLAPTTATPTEVEKHYTSFPLNPTSINSLLATAIPISLIYHLQTNSPEAIRSIYSQFTAHHPPAWFTHLPHDVQTYLVPVTTVKQEPAAWTSVWMSALPGVTAAGSASAVGTASAVGAGSGKGSGSGGTKTVVYGSQGVGVGVGGGNDTAVGVGSGVRTRTNSGAVGATKTGAVTGSRTAAATAKGIGTSTTVGVAGGVGVTKSRTTTSSSQLPEIVSTASPEPLRTGSGSLGAAFGSATVSGTKTATATTGTNTSGGSNTAIGTATQSVSGNDGVRLMGHSGFASGIGVGVDTFGVLFVLGVIVL